jgi:hypothetical protein
MGFMPIIGFIGIAFIIGIPMFEFGIAFIMMRASYEAPRFPQGIGRCVARFPLLVRRSVSLVGNGIRADGRSARMGGRYAVNLRTNVTVRSHACAHALGL